MSGLDVETLREAALPVTVESAPKEATDPTDGFRAKTVRWINTLDRF